MLTKKFDSIIIGLLFVTFLSSCAAPNAFGRYKGRALKFEIPLYQGTPPQEYTYKSLGPVRGEYKSTWLDNAGLSMSNALENLAKNAKETKANAVIKVQLNLKDRVYTYVGEAVIFDNMPKE